MSKKEHNPWRLAFLVAGIFTLSAALDFIACELLRR